MLDSISAQQNGMELSILIHPVFAKELWCIIEEIPKGKAPPQILADSDAV